MSSMTGEALKLSLFGQSHGAAIGMVLDGLPAGEPIDTEALGRFLLRRAPGRSALTTSRREEDAIALVSGVENGHTCGAPLCAIIENTNTQPEDYEAFRDIPRPSHADYPAAMRYGGWEDARGGGHFSGRLTAPLCIAGGICMQLLHRRGIAIGAHLEAVGTVHDCRYDPVELDKKTLLAPGLADMPALDEEAGARMEQEIRAASQSGDSVGGVVECGVVGMPPGIGDPMFGGLENRIAALVFGIPGIRGIEFGTGFQAAQMTGSTHNDPYCAKEGVLRTKTNHHGGILGGISTGMPILFRVAFKPTPSIAMEQQTVRRSTLEETVLSIPGRHDACIALRAVPCVEAAAAIALLDGLLLLSKGGRIAP